MSKDVRLDGRPFVRDRRGAVPRYVIEDNEGGMAVIINQFSGASEVIGPRPFARESLRIAIIALHNRKETEK
jgi:hypothetical protein